MNLLSFGSDSASKLFKVCITGIWFTQSSAGLFLSPSLGLVAVAVGCYLISLEPFLDSWQEESEALSTFNCFDERSSFYLFESVLNEIDSLELLKLDPSSELLGKNLAE